MPRAKKLCSVSLCPNTVDRTSKRSRSRCDECERKAEQARGTARQRGYDRQHETRFRPGVLARHPICVLCHRRRSVHADHYPLSRRDLVDRGLDPNDPKHGRGLCQPCHSRETASNQPGGWNVSDSP